MIRCLPAEVQGKLRSGVALPSLQQCVEELLLNSVDAGATCVGVRVDMEAFKVQVIDNGSGMSAEDMESVGARYHTSKCSRVEDLEELQWHGYRGEALASIVSLASLVEVSSRTRSSVKTHVKVFKDGKGTGVFEAESIRPSAGTTVIVCNFFHNMPVRRKRVDPILEGERIRQRVEAISLMHPSLSFTLKDDCTGAMMVQLPKARNTYHRFVQIHGLGRAQKLREISFTHGQFCVAGHLGREGHYNNSLQFLYVNERLLLKTRVHRLLNALLRRLSCSSSKQDGVEEPSTTRSPKIKRSQEMYGVYIINIKCSYSEYDICLEPAKTLIEFKDWDGILLCVEETVKAFMRRENLVAVVSQDDLEDVSPPVFVSERAAQEGGNVEGAQGITDVPTLDCSIATKLASESVHRKRTDGCESKDSVCMETGGDESEQGRIEPAVTVLEKNHIVNGDKIESRAVMGSEADEGPEASPQFVTCHNVAVKYSGIKSKCAATASDVKATGGLVQQVQCPLNHSHRTLPHIQCVDGPEQASLGPTKISVSEPYVHESLQIQSRTQTDRPADKLHASKRKISVESERPRFPLTQWRDFTPVVPCKALRLVPSQKISIHKHLGSLDKFRRTFIKPSEVKLPSFKDPIDSEVWTREGACQEVVTETQSSSQSPETSSESLTGGTKTSLAAKLCNLKQRTEESLHMSGTTCEDAPCGGDDAIQDESPCAPTLNPEPASSSGPSPQDSAASDWLHHYDSAAGRTVYVNQVTGLSRYEDPAVEETEVRCTSDVTNMAVSVISEMGFEYRCYPFQADVVLPFLPKSRLERVLSSGLQCRDDAEAGSNSLSSLYSKWNNPVFVRPPMIAVDISSGHGDGLVVKIHNILFPYRFSKAMIHSMKVVNQVDKKFLACLINTTEEGSEGPHTESEGNLLVLVDQHAAHERVRLENLVADSYEKDPDVTGERRLCSSNILPPLQISVTEEEQRLLRSCQSHLRSLGLEVSFSQVADPGVFVGKVPLCFMEKESNELRRGRPSVIKPIVEEYIREQVELLRSTGRVRGTLPLTVLKVLASLACHGAVKFNTTLSEDECHSLVSSLSTCQLPFQCAHGRPSIVPLVDVLHLDKEEKGLQKPNMQKLRRMYKAWQLFGNK